MEENKSKGLGDTIGKITKVTGIDNVVNQVNKLRGKKDCGCKKRKEALNKKFPYKKTKVLVAGSTGFIGTNLVNIKRICIY